jgi:alkylhydroperoxidase family enzyme
MKEDEIAGLDGSWAEFTPAERAAYAYTRKLTYEPHRITGADIDLLRKHYTDVQILEMTLSMARNNSTNRWKEGAGIPQSPGSGYRKPSEKDLPRPAKGSYLSPTSEQYKKKATQVAPFETQEQNGVATPMPVARRPALETREEAEKALAAARKRVPRLPLVDEAKARALLPADWPAGPLPQWVRLLANFPLYGKSEIASIRAVEEKGDLKPVLKAQVSWIIARQDRAWYAAGQAKARLTQLGWSDDQIYKLDGSWKEFTPAERAMFTVARQLAAAPIVLTDAEVADALKHTSPRDVVQLIRYVTARASFDRVTEAAGLQLEN